MDTEKRFVDNTGDWKRIEKVHKLVVYTLIVCSYTFFPEVVLLSHASGLVVSPQKKDMFRVLNLNSNQQCDDLKGLIPSIDIISKEDDLLLILGKYIGFKNVRERQYFEQIENLSMDISDDSNWVSPLNDIGLIS